MNNRLLPVRSAPTWAVVLALVLVAGLAMVAAREVTGHLRGDQPARPAAATGPDTEGGAPPLPTVTPPAPGELAPGTGSDPIIGPPSIEPVDRGPVPDQVTLQPGQMPDLTGPPPAATPPPDPGTAPPDDSGGPGSVLERPDVTTGERAPPPPSFGVGIRVTAGGHFATAVVGVSGGPDGLAALSVEFGDGGVHQLSEEKVAGLREGGTLRVVHRYEPTLTPQPQRAVVSATDGAGRSKQAAYEFETQAEFRLRFSPLTATALDDCDAVGKGDFKLEWNLDGGDHSSRFDLGKGDSYVENQFRTTIYGVSYGNPVYYDLRISELDFAGRVLTPWEWELPFEFHGPAAPAKEVVELGTHTYPVTVFYATKGEDNCSVRLDYSYSVIMFD
jgi:hypothetical protein